MAGLGRKVFVAGDILTAAQVQGYLQDQSIMSFATTGARGSAIPSPTEGMFSYLQDTNQISYYDGSEWINAPGDRPLLVAPNEPISISATASGGTVNIDSADNSITYYTTAGTANFAVNLRGNASLSMNDMLSTGQTVTSVFLNTTDGTAYYPDAYYVDGGTVTPKWQGGAAPTAGNASSVDVYSFTVIKTAGSAFTVLASQTQFA